MKFLIKALLRARRELPLFVLSLVTLGFLTLASQIEMFSLGILADSGADFFKMFQADKAPHRVVTYEDMCRKWDEIDVEGTGITREHAEAYLATSARGSVLRKAIYCVKSHLQLQDKASRLIIFLFMVACFKAFFLFFSRYTTRLLGIRVSRDLRKQYFDHLQTLPMSFHQKHTIGALASRVANDSHQISSSINSMILNYVHAPSKIITTLGLCFFISWRLSLVIFVGLPLVILPIMLVARKVKKVMRQLQRNQEQFTSVLVDFLAGIQTVKVFAMEAFSMKKYSEQNNRMAQLESKTAKYDLLTRPILHTITMFCLAAVIIFGMHVLDMKIAEIAIFIGLLQQFYEPVKKFAEENSNVQKGVVAAERMEEVLRLKPKHVEPAGLRALQRFQKKIVFDRLSFRYEKNWVLRNLSFKIEKGETVALVGATGAGKSTIVNLLTRLFDWEQGEIQIDGQSIKRYTKKSVRELIAFVPQRPFLFKDTVAANIAYGRPFPKEDIVLAAKQAHADGFISELPQSYDTVLDEMGKNLSGGQQQRLAIARALVKKAPILVLDEATSALDAVSEKHIKLAIQELRGLVTQILIAHRLSTIENADRIIYLEQGRIAAEGTREFLLAHCAPFKLMWDTHFQASARF
ncbi:MAG: ABC transporter ATP-binding protein [Chlamydiota bacterium]